jgi:Spy/CpxP family protein refolding chaperone
MNSNPFTSLRRASLGVFSVITTALAVTGASAQPADPAPATPAPGAPPAQDGGRAQRGGNNVQRGGNFGGGLNFDEKQRELLQEARQVHTEELRKLNEKLAEAQKEFVKAVVAEKYDETVVKAKADAIGKIQAEILALNGKSFATVSPTLKPEQRESIEGNARIGYAIISPTAGFGGGPGGNFAAGGAAGFGGGRGNNGGDAGPGGGGRGGFGPGGGGFGGADAGGGADRAIRRGGDRGAQGAPGAPGVPGNNTRRRGGDNQGQ